MNVNLTFVHILRGDNFGDAICSPRNYFHEWQGYSEVDFRDLAPGESPVIVGGGGTLCPEADEEIYQISRTRPCVAWGIGLNYHSALPPADWPLYLERCKLVSLRDSTVGPYQHCPDPTCLHPAFDTVVKPPCAPVVTYSHWQNPIQLNGVSPGMTDACEPGKTLEKVLDFLSAGAVVVTNSYHGALWALWLGRQVILWKPLATRFYTGLPLSCPVANSDEEVSRLIDRLYEEYSRGVNSIPGGFLLSKARYINRGFREKVRALWGV